MEQIKIHDLSIATNGQGPKGFIKQASPPPSSLTKLVIARHCHSSFSFKQKLKWAKVSYFKSNHPAEKDHEEHIEVTDDIDPELEKLLQTDTSHGLTDDQVQERLETFGKNGNLFLQNLRERNA